MAAKNPAKLKKMQDIFMEEAKKYQVLPLDLSVVARLPTLRPSITAGRNVFTRNPVDLERIKWTGADVLSPGKHTLEFDF